VNLLEQPEGKEREESRDKMSNKFVKEKRDREEGNNRTTRVE